MYGDTPPFAILPLLGSFLKLATVEVLLDEGLKKLLLNECAHVTCQNITGLWVQQKKISYTIYICSNFCVGYILYIGRMCLVSLHQHGCHNLLISGMFIRHSI